MVRALLDTNILIDQLHAVDAANAELARYEDRAISIVTWIEVMVGAAPSMEKSTRAFLGGFTLIELDVEIAAEAARLRREERLKLPDAIIWASARRTGRLLVTRNTRDFPTGDPGVRVPYII
jgi:predicted nucleic acid-binding protein